MKSVGSGIVSGKKQGMDGESWEGKGIVALMRRWEVPVKCWLASLKGTNHSEDLQVDGRVLFKWTSRKCCGQWIDSSAAECGPVARSCDNGGNLRIKKRRGIYLIR
jgi:hypothetical protein